MTMNRKIGAIEGQGDYKGARKIEMDEPREKRGLLPGDRGNIGGCRPGGGSNFILFNGWGSKKGWGGKSLKSQRYLS